MSKSHYVVVGLISLFIVGGAVFVHSLPPYRYQPPSWVPSACAQAFTTIHYDDDARITSGNLTHAGNASEIRTSLGGLAGLANSQSGWGAQGYIITLDTSQDIFFLPLNGVIYYSGCAP